MRRSVRNLLCIAFVGALAIACSKKKQEPVGAPAQGSAPVTPAPQPTVVTEPPAPPPPATVDVPPATATTPPASSVATGPARPAFVPPEAADKKKFNKGVSNQRRDGEEDGDLSKALADRQADEPATKTPAAPPPAKKPAKHATAPKPAPTTTPPPATASGDAPKDKEQRESQPEATALKHRVTVTTASHYACTAKDHKESVSVASETRGARITIGGQGPCPGEIKEWIAEVGDKRVDVHGTHGAQSKCTCAGTGDMVLRGLDPGTYDVHVNGGFNRPIAVRVVVGSP